MNTSANNFLVCLYPSTSSGRHNELISPQCVREGSATLRLNKTGCAEISVPFYDTEQLLRMVDEVNKICKRENLTFTNVHTFIGDHWNGNNRDKILNVLTKFTNALDLIARDTVSADNIRFHTAS